MENIFTKCYGARISLQENNEEVDEDCVLVFKNLKLQGYKTEDRLGGFDMDSAKLVIRYFALFHTTSIALQILNPQKFDSQIRPCLVHNKGLEQLPEEVGEAFHNIIMETAKQIRELSPHL